MMLAACPLCADARITPFVEAKGYHYHRCAACGFAFLNPMPMQIDLNETYQGQRGVVRDFYPHAASRRRKALLRAARFLPYCFRRTVIDIGCGGGFFVNAARVLGARLSCGLDVDAQSIAYARREFPKCDFTCASFDSFRPEVRFDFVHCSEVIEHLPDPHALMRLLVACCKPRAHAFITTPDLSSPNVPANVAEWAGFGPPAHVGLFSRSNLLKLFGDYGFVAVRTLPARKTGMKILFRLDRLSPGARNAA